MAFRINAARGEIDNRLKDHVMGRIWLPGAQAPLRLNLRGNCLRDMAGMRLAFASTVTQPVPSADAMQALAELQEGAVGDMTASRKVNVWTVSMEEADRLRQSGEPIPVKKANCLYLEWYSERNGRVVLETTDFRITEISEPEWRMTADEAVRQRADNLEAMKDFLERRDDAIERQRGRWEPEDDVRMDEFDWERMLRESDARTDKYGELLQRYEGHPDAERIVARAMGWDWLDDALDADARGAFDEQKAEWAAGDEDEPREPEPDPEREGIDWIAVDGDDVQHPLAHRSSEMSLKLWRICDGRGLLGEDGDDDLVEFVSQYQILSVKLAGALSGLAHDESPDPGFIVAYLKRALKYLQAAMAAADAVERKALLAPAVLAPCVQELFAIREGILALMKRFRGQI